MRGAGIHAGIHGGIHGIGHSWPRVNNPVNMKHRICRCAVTAAVTANRQVYRAGVSKSVSKETGDGAAGGVVTKAMVTSVVTKQPATVALVVNLKKPETQDAAKPNKTLHGHLHAGTHETGTQAGTHKTRSVQAMQVQAGAYLFEQYARARTTRPKKRVSGLNQTHGHQARKPAE